MNHESRMITVYRLMLNEYSNSVLCKTVKELMESIQYEVDRTIEAQCMDDGISIHVDTITMTQAEYNALQPHDGEWD